MNTTELKERIDRDALAVKCTCGGYAESVDTTPEERAKYGCGRGSYQCCDRAFVCVLCGNRLVGRAEAPEME